ncbi:MAG: hypothetical protein HYW01_03195 [Deltaproteobacteria bacterium]|nr:hypothetical protein [Deltaproteobacteria bacterium]
MIRAGYDTKAGRILVCENYPKCKYVIIIRRKPDGS